MSTTPDNPTLWKMPDDELIDELSRNGYDWDDDSSQAKKDIALIQEALRRILAHTTDEKVGVRQFMCMNCGGIFPNERKYHRDNLDFCSKRCADDSADDNEP